MRRRGLPYAVCVVLTCLISLAANAQDDAPLMTLETGDVYFLKFLEEGRRVVCNTVVWDLETEEVVRAIQWEETFGFRLPLALSPDRKTLGVGKEYTVSLYDLESADHVRDIPVSDYRPFALAFSPDGRTLAIQGQHATVEFLDIETGDRQDSVRFADSGKITNLAFGPDGNRLLVGYFYSETIGGPEGGMTMSYEVYKSALVSLPDKEILGSYRDRCSWSALASSLAYSPDGSLYAVMGDGVCVHDANTVSKVLEITRLGFEKPPKLAFSPDGTKLLCGPSLHDAHTGERLWRAPLRMDGNEVAYSPDGNKVAIEDTRNRTVTIWDVSDLNTAVQDWPERESKVRRVDGVK